VRRIPRMWFILARVSTTPGGSAAEGYRAARAGRRRGMLRAAVLVALAAASAWGALHSAGHLRLAAAVAAGVLVVIALALRPQSDPERWLRGAAGERATAELLARLPGRRWAVMHDLDIPGHRANIDHLVIGPTGTWVVDTKTARAAVRTGWWSVRIGGRKLDSGPTRWEAAVVSERLGVPVRPLIVLHAEGLRPRGGRAGRVRVIPPGSLVRTLRKGRRRLNGRRVGGLARDARELFPSARFHGEPRSRAGIRRG
jgi:hypothetical protein